MSPRHRLAVLVEILQIGQRLLCDKHIDQTANTLTDGVPHIGTAERGRTQPGAINARARGSPAWRAVSLHIYWLSADLVPR